MSWLSASVSCGPIVGGWLPDSGWVHIGCTLTSPSINCVDIVAVAGGPAEAVSTQLPEDELRPDDMGELLLLLWCE